MCASNVATPDNNSSDDVDLARGWYAIGLVLFRSVSLASFHAAEVWPVSNA